MSITAYTENYFDDVNTPDQFGLTPLDKNYLRVLFRPGRAVQARELNQAQSLLQAQVDRLGQGLFKANSPIVGGKCKFDPCSYIDVSVASENINLFDLLTSDLKTLTIKQGSFLSAVVILVEKLASNGTYRLFIQYRSGDGTSTSTKSEFSNTTIEIESESYPATPLSATVYDGGSAVGAGLENGAFFVRGCIATSNQQYVALALPKNQSYFNGFAVLEISESAVTSGADKTLLDNAAGSVNYSAPGADRYKIGLNLKLVSGSISADDKNYVVLLKIQDSEVVREENSIDASGSSLEKILAQRTFEESGNYTVSGFDLEIQEVYGEDYRARYTLENDLPEGLNPDSAKDRFAATIGDGGIGYVRGSRVDLPQSITIIGNKARKTWQQQSQTFAPASTTADLGTYVEGYILSSDLPDIFSSGGVTLNVQRLDGGSYVTVATCKALSIEVVGDYPSTPGATQVRLYLEKISLAAGPGSNLSKIDRIISETLGVAGFTFNVIKKNGQYFHDTSIESCLFKFPMDSINTIRQLGVTQKKHFSSTLDSQGVAVFTAQGLEFDKSPGSLIVWHNSEIRRPGVVGGYEIIAGSSDSSTLSIKIIGAAGASVPSGPIKIIASVRNNDIDGSLGIKTLVTESINLTGRVPEGTIVTIPGVYHAVSIDSPEWELVFDGQNPASYDLAKIKCLKTGSTSVRVTHWQFSGPGNYYTVNSYKLSEGLAQAPLSVIPLYKGKRLCDYLDTRQRSGGPARLILDPYSPISALADFYLSRRDTLSVSPSGGFSFNEGVPDINPQEGKAPDDSMILYRLFVPAYTYDVNDISVTRVNNKRYTMRDIGEIEKRVGTLEYYASLSLLEKSVNDKSIFDEGGGNRFKNGFVTDGFRNFSVGDSLNLDHRCSLDVDRGRLYPKFFGDNVSFVYKSDTNISNGGLEYIRSGNHGRSVTLPYKEIEYITQTLSTQTISVQPHNVVTAVGILDLNPEVDTWSDQVTRPPTNITLFDGLDDVITDLAQASGLSGTRWNAWRTTNQNTQRIRRRLFRRTTDQTRTGVETQIVSDDINQSLGSFVSDVSIRPYMRSRLVAFQASGLSSNTRHFLFFDGIDVNAYVRPYIPGAGDPESVISKNFSADDGLNEEALLKKYPAQPIVSNADGVVQGIFIIPNNDRLKFASGEKILKITASQNNLDEESFSIATARFISNGLEVVRNETIISTSVPRVARERVSANRQVITWFDPVAQTFRVDDATGVFVSSIDIYFGGKPPESVGVGVQAYLVTTVNGYPSSDIVPGSEVNLRWNQVNTSTDGSVPSRFSFESPIYLNPDTEYAIVIFSPSAEYTVHIAELGGTKRDFITGQIVSSQPAVGVFFTSSNKTAWNASQNRDLKFVLRRASFKTDVNAELITSPNIPSVIEGIDVYGITGLGSNKDWPDGTTATISAPTGSGTLSTATATPIFDDLTRSIIGFTITAAGSGYLTDPADAPTVTITSPVGVTPVRTVSTKAVVGSSGPSQGKVVSVDLLGITENKGWPTNDTVISIAPAGSGVTATAIAVIDPNTLSITGARMISSGGGYLTAPEVTISSVSAGKTAKTTGVLKTLKVGSCNVNQKAINISGKTSLSNVLKLGNGSYNVISGEPIEALTTQSHSITSQNRLESELITTLGSSDERLSPKVDLSSLSLETREYLIAPVGSTDQITSQYLTKEISLTNPADQIDVYLDINLPTRSCTVEVYGKFKDVNGVEFENGGWIRIPANSPVTIPVNSDRDVFSEVRFSKAFEETKEFSSFVVKIAFFGDGYSDVPVVKDLRAIASM